MTIQIDLTWKSKFIINWNKHNFKESENINLACQAVWSSATEQQKIIQAFNDRFNIASFSSKMFKCQFF